nr:unnamed protein product [Spirometra erinaceieuropaei]
MARFYGLPKVHKPGVPLRPIVSLRGTPTFGLSKWLYQRFRFLTEGSEWTVKSAEEFLKSIRNLEIEPDEMMVSFDVVSLFTSIPTALAISTIDELLQEKYDNVDQQLRRTHITELLELCLRTFFTFGDRVYEQKKGTPMGSPLSGLIAEAVLQRLERLVFRLYSPKFWARYVDDTFVVIKRNDVQNFKVLLNSIFPDIQFTMEEENNNQLPFLDGISEALSRRLKRAGISIAHKPASSLREALCRVKDPVPKEQLINVIYRIPCANCPCVFIGHTGRCLGTHFNEHKLALRRRDPLSLVFAHALEHDHRFKWDGTEVIAMANTRQAREFLEDWNSVTTSINRRVDLGAHYEGLRTH